MTTSTKQLNIFNQTKGFIMTTFTYYIDGEEVTAKRAFSFYMEAYNKAILFGYALEEDEALVWCSRVNEEGRENIYNLTGIHELGGLEIVADDE
jgi:hypothetical protein